MPTETAKAAAAYAAYCALGSDRSLEKLSAVLYAKPSQNLAQLKVWSSKYAWVERALAHDQQKRAEEEAAAAKRKAARDRRKAERAERLDDARDHADDERAPLMRDTWRATLGEISKRLKSGDVKGLMGLTSLLKHAMDEERLDLGAVPTKQQIELSGPDGGPIQIDQWVTIRGVILQALAPYPEAQAAVVQALGAIAA